MFQDISHSSAQCIQVSRLVQQLWLVGGNALASAHGLKGWTNRRGYEFRGASAYGCGYHIS